MPQSPFRLATLLQLRKRVRDERRIELAEVVQQDVALQTRRDALEKEIQGMQALYQQATQPGDLALDQLVDTSKYARSLEQTEEDLAQRELRVAEELERRRDVLGEAEREVRVLEMLHEKHLADERLAESRQENKWLDEASARGHSV